MINTKSSAVKYLKRKESFTKQGKSEGSDSCDQSSNLTQIGFKSSILQLVWPWTVMDDLKQKGTCSLLHQALCIISKPLVNSNLSYSPETFNSGQNWRCFVLRDLEICWMTLKTIGHIFYTISSLVHHFRPIGEFKLELQSGNTQFQRFVVLWNLTTNLEKQ